MIRTSSPHHRSARPGAVLRALAAAAVTVVAVAGCGGQAPTAAAPTAPAASSAFPVSIKNVFGTAEIKAQPKRVVSVGYNEGDFPLALGVVPLAEREFSGGFDWQNRAWATAAKNGAQPVVLGATLEFEKIAALKPDLILGIYSFMDKATYDKLSLIAPTLATPNEGTKAATWQEQTRITAEALGLKEKGEQVIAATEKKFTDLKAANPALAGKTLALDYEVTGVPYKLGTDDLRAQLFAGLGLNVGDKTQTLSQETLQPLDQQALVVLGQTKEQLATNQLFQSLTVVKSNKTLYMGDFTTPFAGALGYSSPLSLGYAADIVAPQLQKILAG